MFTLFQCVVSFYEEEVDLVVSSCISLFQKCFVEIVLISVVIRWSNVPYNIYITDLTMSSVYFFISRIVIGQTGFEFFVPAVNV